MAVSVLQDSAVPAPDRPVTVGFAGLTHTGIVAALAAAAKGARVVAFDPTMALVARLKRGDLPVVAPGLLRQATAHRSPPDYTATAADLSQCDVIYICAEVPVSEKGRGDLTALQAVLDDASAAARPDAVLVVSSAVLPGCSRAQAPKGRSLYYQLDALAFDEETERATEPKRLVIGCADPALPLPAAFQRFLELFGCPILRMRYESAELGRLALRLRRIAGSTAIATVAALSEKVGAEGADVASVLEPDDGAAAPAIAANALDAERDLAMLRRLAETHSVDAALIESGLARVRQQRNWVLQCLEEQVLATLPDARLTILGLASRRGTTSTVDSPTLALLKLLPKLPVRVYDPAVPPDQAWHEQLEVASDALDACREADAVVIMTPWQEFAALDPAELVSRMRGTVIIDPHGVLDSGAARRAGLSHHIPV